jgi:ABC-type xylose transport system permease subunit
VSSTAKVVYFIVALLVMACFAVGSVMMAEDRPGIAAVLFIVAIVGAGVGFATKRKVMKR